MQPPVELQRPLNLHWIWLLIALILLCGAILLFLYIKKNKYSTTTKKIKIKKPNKKSIEQIKKKYLAQLDELEKDIRSNKVDNRTGYQKLSIIIRTFVYTMTGIFVQNYTLEEIKPLRMPRLTHLVEEYYEPEFSHEELGNVLSSLSKTRKEIEAWH